MINTQALLSPNIDEPFEWQKLADVNGQEAVYFKTQNPYTYSEAIQYCNRQEIDEKLTEVGIHSSQLWKFDETTKTLINKQGTPFENAQIWMGKNTIPILLLNDDIMIGEH